MLLCSSFGVLVVVCCFPLFTFSFSCIVSFDVPFFHFVFPLWVPMVPMGPMVPMVPMVPSIPIAAQVILWLPT